MADSVFTKIINREYSADVLYEDEKCIVIFDISPLREGHSLVIPKKQVDNFLDINDEEFTYLMKVSKKISQKLKDLLNVSRVLILIEGFEVPHAHIHLIPSNTPLRLSDKNPPLNYKDFRDEKGLKIISEFNGFQI